MGRLLSYPELKARGIRYSRQHLRRLERAGKFPAHIQLGKRAIAWDEDEIDQLVREKKAARPPLIKVG